jgi:hypothetical protein
VVVATWFNSEREVISESFYLTRSRDPEALPLMPGDLQATAASLGDGRYQLTLQSHRFLHAVRLSAKGFLPDDNYFHLPPARQKTVTFTPISTEARALRATIEALNVMGEHAVNASGS